MDQFPSDLDDFGIISSDEKFVRPRPAKQKPNDGLSFPPLHHQALNSPKSSSAHGTGSAFSSIANPNEDWTKISDLAERRRIQNRIAQRNYRKKLKRRLEDLEKRAATASESPERTTEQVDTLKPANTTKPRAKGHRASKSTSDVNSRAAAERLPPYDYYTTQDHRGSMFSYQYTRQLSATPPPVLSYSPYSHADHYEPPAYGQPPAYHALPSFYHELQFQGDYGSHQPSANRPPRSNPSLRLTSSSSLDSGYYEPHAAGPNNKATGNSHRYECQCGNQFRSAADLKRHKSTVHKPSPHKCPVKGCIRSFFPKDNLVQHLSAFHGVDVFFRLAMQREESSKDATAPTNLSGENDSNYSTKPEEGQTTPKPIARYNNHMYEASDLPDITTRSHPPTAGSTEPPRHVLIEENGLSSGSENKAHYFDGCTEPALPFSRGLEQDLVPSWLYSIEQETGPMAPEPQSLETNSPDDRSSNGDSNLLHSPPSKSWSSDTGSSEGEYSDVYGDSDSIFGDDSWVAPLEGYENHVCRFKSFYANCLYWLVLRQIPMPYTVNAGTPGRETPSNSQPSQSSESGSFSAPNGKGKRSGESSRSGKKNYKNSCGQGEDDDDDRSNPSRPSKRQRSEGSAPLRFACPFFKRHPDIFITCGMSDHESPSRVKAHINRKHRLPIYCPRCSEIFKSEQERDSHLRGYSCTVQPETRRICATYEQIQRLSRRSTGKTDKDRWNEIYGILFPDDPLPESPYLDSTVSAEVNLVREAFLHAAPAAVRTAIRMALPEALQETTGDEELERIVHTTHVEVFDRVLRGVQSNRPGSQRLSSSFGSDVSRSPDSGIGGSSNAGASQPEQGAWQDQALVSLPELSDSQLEEMTLALPFDWSFGQSTYLPPSHE